MNLIAKTQITIAITYGRIWIRSLDDNREA